MSDNQPVEAKVQRLKQVSPIWIVPLVALGIGIWMFVQYLNSQGPVITIRLPNASGIEVGKTAIKSLNVKVGVVTKVQLIDLVYPNNHHTDISSFPILSYYRNHILLLNAQIQIYHKNHIQLNPLYAHKGSN